MTEFYDKLDNFEYNLATARQLVDNGNFKRADELLFKLKPRFEELHRLVWLKHHNSGENG